MKQTVLMILSLILFLKGLSQSTDSLECEKLEEYNQYLWLDAPGVSLIDNALRCFKLSSIIDPGDSCIRIWVYEDDYPDSPLVYRMKLFEIGINHNVKYATYKTLEWERQGLTSKVKCIRERMVKPLSGWAEIEKKIKVSHLNKINTIPIPSRTDDLMTDGFFLFLQYVSASGIINIEFTGHYNIGNSKYKKIRKFAYLLRLIKKEFSVNLSLNNNGSEDF